MDSSLTDGEPTVPDVMKYDDENVKEHILSRQRMTADDLRSLGERPSRVFNAQS